MSSRNAPCPCGSGRKYKYCHGAAASPGHPAAELPLAANHEQQPVDDRPDSIEEFRKRVGNLISGRQPEQLDLALEFLSEWQLLQPRSFEVLRRQLEIHLYRGDLDRVAKSLQTWSGLKSKFPEFDYFRGVLAQLLGDKLTARQNYAAAILQQRRNSSLEELDEAAMGVATAIQLYETAAGNYPGSPSRSEDGMFGSEAELQLLEQALLLWEQTPGRLSSSGELKRIQANAWYNLGCAALAGFTADDRRIELFEKAIELDRGHLLAQFNRAFAHNYSFSKSPEQIYQAHLKASRWLESRQVPELPQRAFKTGGLPRRIRLAYLSSDFRQHSVAHFILPVLQRHNREMFEVFVYHNHARIDEFTRRVKQNTEHFRPVARLSDDQLRAQILADGIDVLVDLNGLTNGHRLAVLAQRAAPLQVSWIGYPNTTGLMQMDWRIVDALTDPPGQSEAYCSEKLVRLPHPFLCFAFPEQLPAVSTPPCLQNGYITFGSFNALPKLNPALLQSWAKIMLGVPGSRLLIKNFGMDFEGPRNTIRQVFAGQSISGDRLIFAGKNTSVAEHLSVYGRVDICLDTFPYNGTTTTCDSLVMGVPVVSRAGDEHRSRVGLSLLSAIGLESLVASDENALCAIVTTLAANPQELQSLRMELRTRFMQSRLGDAALLTANLERQLIHARDHWQATTQESHEQ